MPETLTARPLRIDDVPAWARLLAAAEEVDPAGTASSAFRAEFSSAATVAGDVVAYLLAYEYAAVTVSLTGRHREPHRPSP